ncbi:metallophosphoesterase [Kordiimonas aquimaris]|uniref:metallophosphoesterase n=1 Tax=Kordiimonas aquimaris TaxID=707591 RepID=UPI0021D28430|nr:metallophosphoesterase [Kordiimonas aquimaris]
MDSTLTFRPREVHIGVPLFECKESLTVFDKDWLANFRSLEMDWSRVQIPPNHAGFTAKNLRQKFVFEFVIPPPEKALFWRQKRAQSGLFPFEKHLDLDIVKAQSKAYLQIAQHLHTQGVPVHVRDGYNSPPKQFSTPVIALADSDPLVALPGVWIRSIASKLRGDHISVLTPTPNAQTLGSINKLPPAVERFHLTIRNKRLLIIKDQPLGDPEKSYPKDWLILDMNRYLNGEGGMTHLKSDSSVLLGGKSKTMHTLALPKILNKEPIKLINKKGVLYIDRNESTAKIVVQSLPDDYDIKRLRNTRISALESLHSIFGGPFEILPPHQALSLINATNELLKNEAYRPLNQWGEPGAIIELPSGVKPVIVGDLHGQIDNLLKILALPEGLQGMESGQSCLVLLGDMVHGDMDHELENMESSTLMLDLIMTLKCRFPQNFFMLRGNHESFSADVSKADVMQGVLFEQQLIEQRGIEYRDRVQQFFQGLPYIVRSKDFIATHAAPARGTVSFETLVDIAKLKGYAYEVTHNRVIRPGFSMGYTKGDIKNFRKALRVKKGTPFLVGHTRPSEEGGVWENFTRIKNFHILYSSGVSRFGFMIGRQNGLQAYELAREPIVEFTNQHLISGQPEV